VPRKKSDILVEAAYQTAMEYYQQHGTSLTLRGLFYILVSKDVIPNTKNAYKRLSEVLAKARYKGEFPWYLIKDATRRKIYKEIETWYPTSPLSPEDLRRILEDYINSYTNVNVNPWEDQRFRIIVVVEKEALADAIDKFIDEVWSHGVYQIRVIRGYDSATDIHELAKTIESIPDDQTPVVLQLGDYDPSGEDIVRDFRERLKMLAKRSDIIFEKVAVTLDQIIELQLPCKPETLEEIEKMRRDPRYKSYIAKLQQFAETDERVKRLLELYGSVEIRVELDALVALKPDEFKKILRATIEKYFDYNIYNTVTKAKEEELKKKAEQVKVESLESLKKLLGQQ
jgi:5S rRNA maturation endonuclease (ribonuclease M5)